MKIQGSTISYHSIDETTYGKLSKSNQTLILAAYNELASNSSNRASALLSAQDRIYAGHASVSRQGFSDPAEEQAIRRGFASENLELRIKRLAIVCIQNPIPEFVPDFHCPDMPDYVARDMLYKKKNGKNFDIFLVPVKTDTNKQAEELHEAMRVYKTTLMDWYPI